LSGYLPAVFALSILIAGALAVIMVIIGGIQYIGSESFSSKSAAKETIQKALIGLLLAIGAYAILYTIGGGDSLLRFNISLEQHAPPVPASTAGSAAGAVTNPPGGNVGTVTPGNNTGNPANNIAVGTAFAAGNDPAIRNLLMSSSNGLVSINNQNCLTVGQTGCTSLSGLTGNAVNGLLALANLCSANPACASSTASSSCIPPAPICVTGGTEYWVHGTRSQDPAQNNTPHKTGTVVDVSINNPALNAIIQSPANVIAGGSSCAPGPAYNVGGVTYVNEQIPGNPPHYHVCLG
jgi:hypothetical protein